MRGAFGFTNIFLEIRTGSVTKKLVILPCETIGTAVNTAAVAIHRISPTAFPIGCEGLGDHLFCCDLFENFELRGWGFTNIFS